MLRIRVITFIIFNRFERLFVSWEVYLFCGSQFHLVFYEVKLLNFKAYVNANRLFKCEDFVWKGRSSTCVGLMISEPSQHYFILLLR